MAEPFPIVETGVPGLDHVLGGGIPEYDTLLVIGPPGSGKTILCFQTLFHQARAGRNVLYVSAVSESPLRLIRHLRPMAFFDDRLIGRQVFLLNLDPLIAEGLDRVVDAILQQVRDHQISFLAFDGFDSTRDIHPGLAGLRACLYKLLTMLAAEQLTTMITSGPVPPDARPVEQTMVDGILELGRESVGSRTIRTVSCLKMRAMSIDSGVHVMTIGVNGVTIFPRFESTYVARDVALGNERVGFGLPELDHLMSGGPFAGGSLMVAGAVGAGKTLLSLQYLSEGIRKGERCLFAGFRESPSELVRLGQRVQIDVQPAVDSGQLVLFHRAPVEMLIDEVTEDLLREVERFRPQRLVIDSIDEMERAIVPAQRRWDFLVALSGWLHDESVTSLFTREVSQVVGTELDFAETPLADLATNLILLRWVEFRGVLFRILSILKMKGSAFDSSIRQFEITSSGIRVLQKVQAAEGLLTGVARLTSPRSSGSRASRGSDVS